MEVRCELETLVYFAGKAPQLLFQRNVCVGLETDQEALVKERTLLEQAVERPSNINPLNAELNPICHLLALLGVHFFHTSRLRVKSLTLRLLMSYIYIYMCVCVCVCVWSTHS
jgi:hypothetical protein